MNNVHVPSVTFVSGNYIALIHACLTVGRDHVQQRVQQLLSAQEVMLSFFCLHREIGCAGDQKSLRKPAKR